MDNTKHSSLKDLSLQLSKRCVQAIPFSYIQKKGFFAKELSLFLFLPSLFLFLSPLFGKNSLGTLTKQELMCPPDITGIDTIICNGQSVQLFDLVDGIEVNGWEFGTDLNYDMPSLVSPTVTTTYFVRDSSRTDPTCVDTARIIVTVVPIADITGRDTMVCAGETVNLFSLLNETPSGTLSAGENLTFSGPSSVNPFGTTTYFIRDSVNANCLDITSVTVNVIPNPSIRGMDITICEGQTVDLSNQIIGAVSGELSYSNTLVFTMPNNSAIVTPPIGVSSYFIRDSLTDSGCVDTARVLVNTVVTPQISGRDTLICEGQMLDLSTLVIDNAAGTLEYGQSLNFGGSNMVIPPLGTTTYFIRDSINANCVDTARIVVETVAVPNIAGRDSTTCVGQMVDLSTLVVGTASGVFEYGTSLNFGGSNTDNPSVTTTYFVRDSISPNCVDTARIIITVVPEPNITGRDTAICTGESIDLSTLFDGTVSGTLSYGTNLAFNGTNMVTPSMTTTTYFIRDSVNANCVDTARVVVTLDPVPNISTRDTIICAGENVRLFTLVSGTQLSSLEFGTDLNYNSPSNVTPSVTTRYFIRDSVNSTTCVDTASLTVSVFGTEITARDTAICGGATVDLSTLVNGMFTGSQSYGTDFTFSGSAMVTPTATTTYFVRDSFAALNCVDTARIIVTVNPTPDITGRDTAICVGQMIDLSTLITGTPVTTLEYGEDLTFAGNAMVTPMTTTTYFVRDSVIATGCIDTARIVVTVNPLPAISGRDTTICEGETIDLTTLLTGTLLDALEVGTTLNFGLGTSVTPTTTTTYFLRDSVDATGCVDTARIIINVDPQPLITGRDTVLCLGASVDLALLISGTTQGMVTYGTDFTFGLGGSMVTPTVNTTYFVRDSFPTGCVDTAKIELTVLDIEITGRDTVICAGEVIHLDSLITGTFMGTKDYGTDFTYGEMGMVSPTMTSTYFVRDSSMEGGCVDTARVIVTVNPSPNITGRDTAICAGESLDINTLLVGTPISALEYGVDFSFGLGTINTITPTNTIAYFVRDSVDATGCLDTTRITITVNPLDTTDLSVTLCDDNATFMFNDQTLDTAGVYFDTLMASTGCDSLVRLTIFSEGDTIFLVENICEGSTFSFNNQMLDTSGVYFDTLMTASGCDSLLQLDLTVLPIVSTSIQELICRGDTLMFGDSSLTLPGTYLDTLASTSTGCDSIVQLELSFHPSDTVSFSETICFGETYDFNSQTFDSSGFYIDTLTALSNGCDSFVQLILTVIPPDTTDILDSICAGASITFNDQTLDTVGVYFDTLTGSAGCDSLIRLTLSIDLPDTTDLVDSMCIGDTFLFNGLMLDTFGVYFDTLAASSGCDSLIRFTLNLDPPDTVTEVVDSICLGNTINFNGRVFDTAGVYFDTITNTTDGCFDLIRITITMEEPDTTDLRDSICGGNTISFNDLTIDTVGVYFDTFPAVGGCDSIIRLTVSFFELDTTELTASICTGGMISFNGQMLTTTGVFLDTLSATNGCDSIIRLTVTPGVTDTTDLNQILCNNDTIQFNGLSIDTTGIYLDTLMASNGCDSLIRLTVLTDSDTIKLQETICEGTTFTFNGQLLDTTGIYMDTLTSSSGCDSIVQLELAVIGLDTTDLQVTICEDTSYAFNGQMLNMSGVYLDTLANSGGCDSLIRLTLSISEFDTLKINQAICLGDTFDFNGLMLDAPGVYFDTLANATFCDTLVSLTLSVLGADTTVVQETICSDDTFNFNGQALDSAGVYFDTLTSSIGCDSLIRLELMQVDSFVTRLDENLCMGETYILNGRNLTVSGNYREVLTSANGCDSIILLDLTIRPLPTISIQTIPCAADLSSYSVEFTINGDSVSVSHGMLVDNGNNQFTIADIPVDTAVAIAIFDTTFGCVFMVPIDAPDCGCDIINPPVVVQGDFEICEGDSIPTFIVMVDSTETVDWYDLATGGTKIDSNRTELFPPDTLPGNHVYYAITRDTITGCESSTRTPASISIFSKLTVDVLDTTVNVCPGDSLILRADTVPGATYAWFEITNPTAMISSDQNFVVPNASAAFAGSYFVQITTTEGCVSDPSPIVVVTVDAAPVFTIDTSAIVPISECGNTDGVIIIDGFTIGDSYTINYTLNGMAQSSNITANNATFNLINLAAGSYDDFVIINTSTMSNCMDAMISGGPFIVADADAESPTYVANTETDPTDCGVNDGTITIDNLTAGTIYQVGYDFNGTTVTATNLTANTLGQIVITGLAAGDYNNFTFNNSTTTCDATLATLINLSDAAPFTVNLINSSLMQPTSCTTCNGSFTFNGLEANATYDVSYLFNNTATSESGLTANNAGTLTLMDKCDGNYQNFIFQNTSTQCTSQPFSTPIDLAEPVAANPQITVSTDLNDPTDCGGSDGSITLRNLASGNSYNLAYTQDGTAQSLGPVTASPNGTLTIPNLPAGTYNDFQITNQGTGCQSTVLTGSNFVLTNPMTGVATVSTAKATNPTDCGATDGTITIEDLDPSTAYVVSFDKDNVTQNNVTLNSNNVGEIILIGLSSGQYDNFMLTEQVSQCALSSNTVVSLADGGMVFQPTTPANITICDGENLNLSITNLNTAPTGVTYAWTGPNGFTAPVAEPTILGAGSQSAGTYSVIATINNCSSVVATTTVSVGTTPTITLSQTGGSCGETLTLSAQVYANGGNNNFSYQWSGPNGFSSINQNISITNPGNANSGTYNLLVTNGDGCQGTASQAVQITNATGAQPAITANKQSFCLGETLELTTNEFTGNTISYIWTITYPDGTTQTFTTTDPTLTLPSLSVAGNTGTYAVEAIVDGCNSLPSNGLSIVVNPPPTIPTIVPAVSICEGEELKLFASTIASQSYQWDGPNGFTSFDPAPLVTTNATAQQSGNYTLTVSANGCVAAPIIVAANVQSTPTAAVVSNNGPVCVGDVLTLRVDNPGNGLTYEWFNANGQSVGSGSTLNLNNASTGLIGDYYVVVTQNGCSYDPNGVSNPPATAFTSVLVSEIGTLAADAGLDATVCTNSFNLAANLPADAAAFGEWSIVGNNIATILDIQEAQTPVNNLQPGNNAFVWTLNGGCNIGGIDTVNIFYLNAPTLTADSVSTNFNTPVNVDVFTNDGLNSDDYTLQIVTQPNGGSATLQPDNSITYIPTPIFDGLDELTYQVCSNDCPVNCSTTTLKIEVITQGTFTMPTVITPNNDGINDFFVIEGIGKYPNSEIIIFNRWGDEVYRDGNYRNDWQGLYKSAMLPVGTYYYVVQVNDPEQTRLSGYVYIQRE